VVVDMAVVAVQKNQVVVLQQHAATVVDSEVSHHAVLQQLVVLAYVAMVVAKDAEAADVVASKCLSSSCLGSSCLS